MFGLFKSKKVDKKKFPEIIAGELFSQIKGAKDEAKSGGLVTEQIFNDRLNSMYVAGYLIGYVDEHMRLLFSTDEEKKENAEKVYELMFPGTGISFVKAKLLARRQATSFSKESEHYQKVAMECMAYDRGLDMAQEEVEEKKKDDDFSPVRLKEYLLLGDVPPPVEEE